MAYAAAMCLLLQFGPSADLLSGRDRVIGILIGIGVMAIVNLAVSPSYAVTLMRRHTAATLRIMADLCRVGLHGPNGPLVRSHGLRQAVYQELVTVGRLDEEAETEPRRHDTNVLGERHALLAIVADLREFLPGFFTVAHHWLDVDLRDTVSEAGMARLTGFALALAATLGAMADQVDNTRHAQRPDLEAELALAETALQEIPTPDAAFFDGRTAAIQVETRLALWRTLLPAIERLAVHVESLTQPGSG